MAKYKYSADMNREIRRIVKNFNEKRMRDIRKKGIAKAPDKRYVKQIKEQFAKQDKDIDLKQIPDQVAVMGTHVIFHSDTNHSEDRT